jgi:16S rRNA (cytosine1402-N4)-methyltransferase
MASPTFYHQPVLLHEALAGLNIQPGGIYLDATFGGGGHSREILNLLNSTGILIAFDQDDDAWRNQPDDQRLIPVKENFRYMRRFLRLHHINGVDGILADLGVSSFQLDTPGRGFSFRFDGPLDLRMDRRSEVTAATIVAGYSEIQLHKLFEQYGEVRNARQLAKQIVSNRKVLRADTVETFKAMIGPVIKGNPNRYLAQVFQALRIEVNDEFGALKDLLQQATEALKPGGRLCVITFHSLEDRIVKQFMKRGGTDEEGARPLLKPMTAKPVAPSETEIKRNPRAGSALLRVAEKLS